MKSLEIPRQQIHNAYLLLSEDEGERERAALRFLEDIFVRDSAVPKGAEERGFRESVRIRIREKSHPDLIEIHPEEGKKANSYKNITVNQVREQISDTVMIRPYEACYKAYLIYHADLMNVSAQNAFLKTLEEPPEYAVFVLLAARQDAFLETILSRVMQIRGAEIHPGTQLPGILSDSYVPELFRLLPDLPFRQDSDILLLVQKKEYEDSLTAERFYRLIEIVLRDVLCYKSCQKEDLLYLQSELSMILRLSEQLNQAALGRLTEEVNRSMEQLERNPIRDLSIGNFLILWRLLVVRH